MSPYSAFGSRLAALGAVALLLVACGEDRRELDAELARDLQLATAQPVTPQLNDVPMDVPPQPPVRVAQSPRAERPAPRAERPAPRPRREPRVERPEPIAESPEPGDENQSAPTGRFRGIGSGVNIGLTTGAQVCTNNLPGDKVVATVTSAIVGEDGAVIPAGSSVVLEVASVSPGDSPESASIVLRPRSVVIDGMSHALPGSVAIESGLARGAQANNSDRKKVIGGAIAGAVLGQVMGRDTRSTVIGAAAGAAAGTGVAMATRKFHACLPAGSAVRVTTHQPIAL